MNRRLIIFIVVELFLISLVSTFAQSSRGAANVKVKKTDGRTEEIKLYDASYALVIGNGNYTNGWDNLPGVKSDVAAVKGVLEKQGFTVETAENLSSRDFANRIQQFIDDYGYVENNRLLIYYAGHGHTLKSTGDGRDLGYVVPIDAPNPATDEIGFKRKAIPMDDIQNYAKKIQAKHALFLFDSCFSGRLVTRSAIVVPPIIQESIAYPVRQFITAGAANQPVPDESIFRRSFVRALEGEADRNSDGYITGTELAEYLKEKVTNYSNRQQTPQYGKINDIELDKGDFVFIFPKTNVVETGETKPVVKPDAPNSLEAVEKEFWELIKNSLNVEDFKLYKQKYPQGLYTNLADLKIKNITFSAEQFINKGEAFFAEKKYDQAIAEYTKAIEIYPKYALAHVYRGDCYFAKQNYNAAIDDFTKAIEIDPNFAAAYAYRGDAFRLLQNYNQAVADTSKAIEINPGYVTPYGIRAVCYDALGKKQLADADRLKYKELGGK